MKFYTWTAAQKGAKGPCTRDWNFFWFSTSTARPLCLHSCCDFTSKIHAVLFCSHNIFYINPESQLVKHCAKSSISCITGGPSGNTPVWLISISKLKAHGMMSGSWGVWRGAHSNGKKKIKQMKNTQETVSRSGTQQQYALEKLEWTVGTHCVHTCLLASAPAYT